MRSGFRARVRFSASRGSGSGYSLILTLAYLSHISRLGQTFRNRTRADTSENTTNRKNITAHTSSSSTADTSFFARPLGYTSNRVYCSLRLSTNSRLFALREIQVQNFVAALPQRGQPGTRDTGAPAKVELRQTRAIDRQGTLNFFMFFGLFKVGYYSRVCFQCSRRLTSPMRPDRQITYRTVPDPIRPARTGPARTGTGQVGPRPRILKRYTAQDR